MAENNSEDPTIDSSDESKPKETLHSSLQESFNSFISRELLESFAQVSKQIPAYVPPPMPDELKKAILSNETYLHLSNINLASSIAMAKIIADAKLDFGFNFSEIEMLDIFSRIGAVDSETLAQIAELMNKSYQPLAVLTTAIADNLDHLRPTILAQLKEAEQMIRNLSEEEEKD